MEQKQTSEAAGTMLGILSIVFWSTNIAFSRTLAERIGPLTTGACLFLVGGVLACTPLLLKRHRIREILALPLGYLLGCGTLFVLYEVLLYVAVGMASDRQQAIAVGLINYLWPAFTLAFSIPLLKEKAGPWLVPGILMALAGIVIAGTQGGDLSLHGFLASLRTNFWPYVMAFVAAVFWALYSNLTRRWAGHSRVGGVPLFLLASGLVLLAVRFVSGETSNWTSRAAWECLYMAVFPTFLAYSFWDASMRKGNVVLVAAISYFTPLLSTLFSGVYLDVKLSSRLLVACALVVAGAIICKVSIHPKSAPGKAVP